MTGTVRTLLCDLTRTTLKAIEGSALPPVSLLLLQQAEEIRTRIGDAVEKEPPRHDLEAMWRQVAAIWRQRRSLAGLSPKVMRKMPYLLYFVPQSGYRFIDVPNFVPTYLHYLEQRPTSRTVRTMLKLFLQEYPVGSRSFDIVRLFLKQILQKLQTPTLEEWRRRVDQYGLLDARPVQLASHLLTAADPEFIVRDAGMNEEWNAWGILREARAIIWDQVETRIRASRNLPFDVERFIRSSARAGRLRIISEKERIALALVRPFENDPPPIDVRKKIVDFFVVTCARDYGDPRIQRANWATVDKSVVESLKKWMVEETLEDFFRLFDQTSNQYQWRYREAFWKAYLRRGYIREAWVVLGKNARSVVKTARDVSVEKYGKLLGALSTQSALLMRIDDLIIAEWTENGSIRIWMDGQPGAPELYATEYDSTILRSSDVAFEHRGSPNGLWQRQVAEYIEAYTGLRVSPAEYMP